MLHRLSAVCLSRQRRRPDAQLQLGQCIVEYVTASEDIQLALSGGTTIARSKIRRRRAYGEDGAVDFDAVAREIQTLRSLIRTCSYSGAYNMDEASCFSTITSLSPSATA
ncbi:hypothetical protein PC114_g19330 [Phytophthora cactorum]|nr:hypothetical protein PC114_g19330 [Phytophthora cactorum]KAG3013059.1 hypothetical protein PC120_g13498 [Phytophthora cactorum]KAG3178552.1 hypothetical protein C6341_g7881 [Phytophthora cactorum]KAG4046410.1 hypothetical protein PC123_g18204 [Phytophthora cactorum]